MGLALQIDSKEKPAQSHLSFDPLWLSPKDINSSQHSLALITSFPQNNEAQSDSCDYRFEAIIFWKIKKTI